MIFYRIIHNKYFCIINTKIACLRLCHSSSKCTKRIFDLSLCKHIYKSNNQKNLEELYINIEYRKIYACKTSDFFTCFNIRRIVDGVTP